MMFLKSIGGFLYINIYLCSMLIFPGVMFHRFQAPFLTFPTLLLELGVAGSLKGFKPGSKPFSASRRLKWQHVLLFCWFLRLPNAEDKERKNERRKQTNKRTNKQASKQYQRFRAILGRGRNWFDNSSLCSVMELNVRVTGLLGLPFLVNASCLPVPWTHTCTYCYLYTYASFYIYIYIFFDE